MRRFSQAVNMVNAPFLARERGMEVREIRNSREGAYSTLVRVTVSTSQGERSVAGTLFGSEATRLVELFGVAIEAELAGDMLYIVNQDAPGFIGRIGTLLGEAGINVGNFNLGRRQTGGEAVVLLSVDQPISADVVTQACALEGVKVVKALLF
jgi:D-3-phosphoglycerate dehydrogenase